MVDLTNVDESSLRSACTAIAGDAGELRELLHRSGQSSSRALDNLGVVLDQARELRLAVIGDFKRGKSSVINAFVGEGLLPTDVLPCTSSIIELMHGPSTVYELVGSGTVRELSREEFMARAGSASAAEPLADAVESWRVRTPLMPQGFVLVDTPGLNEDEQRIALTEVEASRCHSSLLVLAADQLLSRSEQEILGLLPVESTAMLLNRSDLVASDDLDRIKAHLLQRLPEERVNGSPIWMFSASHNDGRNGAGLTTTEEFREELQTFVSSRSLTSRAQRLSATVSDTATELRTRAADRVEVLKGGVEGLQRAHEQALEELDRAQATSDRIIRLLDESSERIGLETVNALRDDWDGLLDKWATTGRRWRSRHSVYDVRRWKAIAEDLADDALKQLQRVLNRWAKRRVDEVVAPEWDAAVDAVGIDVTEFLRSLDRVAPKGGFQSEKSLADLESDVAVPRVLAQLMAGGALTLGIGVAVRAVVFRQVAAAIAGRLAVVANPALIVAGIALLAVQVRGLEDRLRREVRKAMRRELEKPETLNSVLDEVHRGVRKSLDAEIRDVRKNLDIWIDDARSHALGNQGAASDIQAELERRRRQQDQVIEICRKMEARLPSVTIKSD